MYLKLKWQGILVYGFTSKKGICFPLLRAFNRVFRIFGQHVVVDSAIFETIFAPLQDSTNDIMSKEQPKSHDVQMNNGEIVVQLVQKQCRLIA